MQDDGYEISGRGLESPRHTGERSYFGIVDWMKFATSFLNFSSDLCSR